MLQLVPLDCCLYRFASSALPPEEDFLPLPALCDKKIVQEACMGFDVVDDDDDDVVTLNELGLATWVARASLASFLMDI
eukprot:3053367-Amphidinium_carterae.1